MKVSFDDSPKGLHTARPSHFTTSLLKSFDTFIRSKTDSILKRLTFSALVKAKSINLTSCCPAAQLWVKAKVILMELQSVNDVYENVHSGDNANTNEWYFNVIERVMKKNWFSLLGVFEATNFTEPRPLHRETQPFQVSLRFWKSVSSTFSHRPCLRYCQRAELMLFF